MELKRCHLRRGVLASKQLVMPRRQKVMNHHLEMVMMMMMMMEMMKTQEKEQREKQQVQLLEERPVQRNW